MLCNFCIVCWRIVVLSQNLTYKLSVAYLYTCLIRFHRKVSWVCTTHWRFSSFLVKARYSVSMTYNESHDLGGSAPNIEVTVSKRMPILPRLQLYLAIWVLFMKAHIVPHHLLRTNVLWVCIVQRTTLVTVHQLAYVKMSKKFGGHLALTACNHSNIVL